MDLPNFVFSASSTKRAIFFALVLASISWWCVRFVSHERVVATRKHLHATAANEYYFGNAARAAKLLGHVVTLSDTITERIDNMQNQAAAYGKAGEYGKQERLHEKAYRLAERHGLDSLRRISARSLGNIRMACIQDSKYCEGLSGTSTLSRLRAEKPLILFATGLFLLLLYALFDPSKE